MNRTQDIRFEGQHILLVEDNALNQEIGKTLLEMHNLAVDTADDGEQAVDMFSKSTVDYYSAVLMDIRMPVMDGLTAAREIRRMGRKDAAQIPIIAMSANTFREDVQESYAAGMNAHISKPIHIGELNKHLKMMIK